MKRSGNARLAEIKKELKRLCRETAYLLAKRINWKNKCVKIVIFPWSPEDNTTVTTNGESKLKVTIVVARFDVRTVLVNAANPKVAECTVITCCNHGKLEAIERYVKSLKPEQIANTVVPPRR